MYMQNVVDKKFLKILGERVKELRLSKKITQEELGFRIGNSGKQIGRVERGEHNVSTCMIYAISKALEIPIKEFFDF
ncbi:MAG: helix-turn-helix transcriptional regulator [Flavobacteriales bacterium]|nr:helix-turn-helix transcriptional regulator [Flavobacteriales bacterium]